MRGRSSKRLLVIVAVVALTAIYYGIVLTARQHVLAVPPDERALLDRDFSSVLPPISIPLYATKPDAGNHVESTIAQLNRTRLKYENLTPAEKVFLGRLRTPQAIKTYVSICQDADAFRVAHGRMPRNAAEIVMADPNPDQFLSVHPELINPATGKLYSSFKSRPAPLGLQLKPGHESGMAQMGHRNNVVPRWGIKVYRENGKSLLVDTEVMWY